MSLRKLRYMTMMLLFFFPLFSIAMIKVTYDQQKKIEELEERVYSHSRSIGRWAEIVGRMEESIYYAAAMRNTAISAIGIASSL